MEPAVSENRLDRIAMSIIRLLASNLCPSVLMVFDMQKADEFVILVTGSDEDVSQAKQML